METEIFELKANDAGDDGWVQVTKEDWIRAERASGFHPKMSSTDPRYMTTCATASFHSSLGSWGRRRTTA
ncbi:hypothetical protein [Rhizobium leguminosarum]|uniref:hypothetical protein n=1 Tax=Rhizobium leguminosarum TaxID=384 RepID=UPI002E0FEE7C|nr:hypothetical protein U8Q02_40585 [Rhizobium leguminosarum]